MKLGPAIAEFERHLRLERGLAANTTKAYQSDLAHLYRYLSNGGIDTVELTELSPLHLKDFIAHLRDSEAFRPRSISRVLSSLRAFFDYCREREWIDSSPAEGLRNPKVTKLLPVFLVEDEVARLLRAPDRTDRVGFRNYAILIVFLFTGLRLSELVGLNVEDVDFGANTVLIRGKGSKERLVPLHQSIRRVLEEYLADARFHTSESPAPLFVTEDGERMTARMVGYVVEKSVRAAGVSHRITPHKLRHTFATQLLHKGASLLEIKELLGHSQLATTSIYTHTSVERLRNAVEKIEG